MITKSHYEKGAEWRKWDLHLHSPYTFLNNQFGSSSKEDYIQTILDKNLTTVGYTNYFKFHEDDKEIIDSLRTKGITVFPNLEFRIDQKNKDCEYIHIHIIFSDLTNWTHIQDFLGRLRTINDKFCSNLSLQEINDTLLSFNTIIETLNDDPTLNLYEDFILAASPRGQGSFRPGQSDGRGNTLAEKIDNSIQIIFGTSDDTSFFLNKDSGRKNTLAKPVFFCSDAHNLSAIGSNTTWIKADPTFQGLKQTIYEPELRVAIQETCPENKKGYQVIECIQFESSDIGNEIINLNPYLNTVIGGRSTGKSMLLRALALKLPSSQLLSINEFDKDKIKKYDAYANTIAKNMKIIWKDKIEDNFREIEYFQQGFIHSLADDSSSEKLTKIIRNILDKKGKREIFEQRESQMKNISSNISQWIDEYFKIENQLLDFYKQAMENGDKQGIENEIKKLNKAIQENTPNPLKDSEQSEYEETLTNIKKSNAKITQLQNNLIEINKIQNLNFIRHSIDGELLVCADSLRQAIQEKYKNLREETESKWYSQIQNLKESAELEISIEEKNLLKFKENQSYKKGMKILTENSQLIEFKKAYDVEVAKLEKIKKLIENRMKLQQIKDELLKQIKKEHALFFSISNSFLPDLDQSSDNLKIVPLIYFNASEYTDMLKARINLQSHENQQTVDFNYENYELLQSHIFDILNRLLNKSISLKSGVNSQEFAKTLLSRCFYSIKFDLLYENDDFEKMSEGKKAFVVLKLLLDFSDKKCPILIDQPEDDMDNRDIYSELVKYIRKKKIDRQIILATHNPNIVVGSDSELVIVANQHGENRKNENEKKFEYLTGSLENTIPFDAKRKQVLHAQGIREHVCEILEGGNEAFKLREKKYGL